MLSGYAKATRTRRLQRPTYGCMEWLYSAFVSKADTGWLAGVSQTTVDSCDLAPSHQQMIGERREAELSSSASPMAGIQQVIE